MSYGKTINVPVLCSPPHRVAVDATTTTPSWQKRFQVAAKGRSYAANCDPRCHPCPSGGEKNIHVCNSKPVAGAAISAPTLSKMPCLMSSIYASCVTSHVRTHLPSIAPCTRTTPRCQEPSPSPQTPPVVPETPIPSQGCCQSSTARFSEERIE